MGGGTGGQDEDGPQGPTERQIGRTYRNSWEPWGAPRLRAGRPGGDGSECEDEDKDGTTGTEDRP